ncbi:MAG: DUF4301 family protein [Bacteroidales bacterium]|jgi:hypothetical protein|nr:DUF4301 family protein [Bacteroidales bacterium]
MFSQEDIKQIEKKGSSVERVESQLERFRKGFPWLGIISPATVERGIEVLDEAETRAAETYYERSEIRGRCKFIPASGAASRMFKAMFADMALLEDGKDPGPDSPSGELASHIMDFAFYDKNIFGVPEDTASYRLKTLVSLLTDRGLDYGSKPKGVLKFHKYPDGEIRTAFAEHLVEARSYMKEPDGTANLTVTISPEHTDLFRKAFDDVREKYEKKYDIKYNVRFTYQDPATDTIAVDMRNRPFRTETDSLFFRPAGHGALIYNLNGINEELVSIKNVDNVVNERFLPVIAEYKKVLMGECLKLRDTLFSFLRELDAEKDPFSASCRILCDKIESFLDRKLCIQLPLARDCEERLSMIRTKLDRPVRVCGMVKNEGEPGGGPYIVASKDGSSSLQILESVQINRDDPGTAAAMAGSTYFNPVDIVCCLYDYRGRKFDLLKHVDNDAGFISSKSYHGRELKALELPGLWNGAMSDWNTMFVEVPSVTFAPVKEILSLLKPSHR